jgi:hypothetical protein
MEQLRGDMSKALDHVQAVVVSNPGSIAALSLQAALLKKGEARRGAAGLTASARGPCSG